MRSCRVMPSELSVAAGTCWNDAMLIAANYQRVSGSTVADRSDDCPLPADATGSLGHNLAAGAAGHVGRDPRIDGIPYEPHGAVSEE